VKYITETERTKSSPQCPAELFYIFISPCFTPTYTWLIFEVKTFRRATYILLPGSELVSCDTVKSFAAQAKIGKSFAARHGKLKSREPSFSAERAKNNQLCVTCQF
jgi:hypothetical protein